MGFERILEELRTSKLIKLANYQINFENLYFIGDVYDNRACITLQRGGK
jgi:hypothetical protein